jgi:haloalkane dehalogenase
MSAVEALRTPEERFADLPDFPYAPRYVDDLSGYEGLRAHYLNLGPPGCRQDVSLSPRRTDVGVSLPQDDPRPAGEWRSGRRPCTGFGRSDKAVDDSAYTFTFHRAFILRLSSVSL